MTDDPDLLLEAVLEAVMAHDATPETLISGFPARWPDLRALTLIRALLDADEALRDCFEDTSRAEPESRRIRAATRQLTCLADRAERAHISGTAIRLKDLPL